MKTRLDSAAPRAQGRHVLKLSQALAAAALLAIASCAAPTSEAPGPEPASGTPPANPVVGGAAMDPAATLLQNASSSSEHRTLVSGVRAAGLEQTLTGTGPYTLFAPTDRAFERLPNGTMTALLDPANKWLLGQVVRYHLVPGAKTRSQISADARAGGGVATYRTVEGNILRLSMSGDRISVADTHGNRNEVTIADVRTSNGIMHVLGGVLLPTT